MTFTAALELARRGVPVRFVIPDLFLSSLPRGDEKRLTKRDPPNLVTVHLVAAFRHKERDRIAPLLVQRNWANVVGTGRRGPNQAKGRRSKR
jgi:hypothetical protein